MKSTVSVRYRRANWPAAGQERVGARTAGRPAPARPGGGAPGPRAVCMSSSVTWYAERAGGAR